MRKDSCLSRRQEISIPFTRSGNFLAFLTEVIYIPANTFLLKKSMWIPLIEELSHLVKRIELRSNVAYKDFLENDFTLYNQPMKHMSKFTQTVLASIDYHLSKTTRERNFLYLHNLLATKNEFNIDLDALSGPMCYPFLFKKSGLRAAHFSRIKFMYPSFGRTYL